MGHLFSRAFRRLTQCSQSRSQSMQQERAIHTQPNERQERTHLALGTETSQLESQSIAVGQSIDSDEYADLCPPQTQQNTDTNNTRTTSTTSATMTTAPTTPPIDSQPDVEGAVIKIQALVRGHLTRKALKDAHQQSNPNALGQSQFDEESLTRNPPTAVFLSSTPLSLDNYQQSAATKTIEPRERTPLESISEAEADDSTDFQQQDSAQADQDGAAEMDSKDDHAKDGAGFKTDPFESRLSAAPSKLEMPSSGRESLSPVPSEANASIDLNCETPTSVSIDILDHNMKPFDQMASVLHHRFEPGSEISAPSQVEVNYPQQQNDSVRTPGSPLDSEEAAAIRIQSAFRGYRTRKNSPYRSRSPNPNTSSMANGYNKEQVDQQEESERLLTPEEELDASTGALTEGRRSSRPRRRDSSPLASTIDEQVSSSREEHAEPKVSTTTTDIATTDDTFTVREALSKQAGPALEEDVSAEEHRSLDEQVDSLSFPLADTHVSEDLSAALEVASGGTNSNQAIVNGSAPIDRQVNQITSVLQQRRSDASAETDSSILGAALSLNEDSMEQASDVQGIMTQVVLEPIREAGDTSPEASNTEELLEFEARRMIDDLNKATDDERCVLEASETGATTEPSLSVIDDEQQRVIELESDDIERRDPRGQASEERASSISPQIHTEELQFDVQGGKLDQSVLIEDEKRLAVEKEQDGRISSPATSSVGPSTSNENSDDSDSRGDNSDQEAKQAADMSTGKEQQAKKQQQPKGKSKKNRNRRKGKK